MRERRGDRRSESCKPPALEGSEADGASSTSSRSRDAGVALRVPTAHHIARRAFLLAGLAAGIAWVWAVFVIVGAPPPSAWWAPLHLFMAGTVLLAISGATQLFTITWAAAPVSDDLRIQAVQRWLVFVGAAAVPLGVTLSVPAVAAAGGISVLLGILLLAYLIRSYVAGSLLRRFDIGSRFYLLALSCGAVGVVLGTALVAVPERLPFLVIRHAHMHLNLVGLVGLTIAGTLPTFLPTLAHHKAVSGSELVWSFRAAVVAAAALVAAPIYPRAASAATLLVAGILASITLGVVVRLQSRVVRKSFVQAAHVLAGTAWLVAWGVVDGVGGLASGSLTRPFDPFTLAAAVGGVGQILAGSLCYLVPVLTGPAQRLASNIATAGRVPLLPLALANVAAAAMALGYVRLGAALALAWATDIVRRLVTIDRSTPRSDIDSAAPVAANRCAEPFGKAPRLSLRAARR